MEKEQHMNTLLIISVKERLDLLLKEQMVPVMIDIQMIAEASQDLLKKIAAIIQGNQAEVIAERYKIYIKRIIKVL